MSGVYPKKLLDSLSAPFSNNSLTNMMSPFSAAFFFKDK